MYSDTRSAEICPLCSEMFSEPKCKMWDYAAYLWVPTVSNAPIALVFIYQGYGHTQNKL